MANVMVEILIASQSPLRGNLLPKKDSTIKQRSGNKSTPSARCVWGVPASGSKSLESSNAYGIVSGSGILLLCYLLTAFKVKYIVVISILESVQRRKKVLE